MQNQTSPHPKTNFENKSVALFATCLVDAMRPNIGFAAAKLLSDAGVHVVVPDGQTCCGQPALNSGALDDARKVARTLIDAFTGYDFVIVPSGSCAGTVVAHYSELFKDDKKWKIAADELAKRTYELTTFLVDIMGADIGDVSYDGVVTYHDSCSGLRELGIKDQPRKLLAGVSGLELIEMSEANVCCGFGGLFSIKLGEISTAIVDKKTDNIIATPADTLLGGDLGCLMNMSGRLSRRGENVKVYHIAEVLAGMTNIAPIGGGDK